MVRVQIRCGYRMIERTPACVAIRPINDAEWLIQLVERCGKHLAGDKMRVPLAAVIQGPEDFRLEGGAR